VVHLAIVQPEKRPEAGPSVAEEPAAPIARPRARATAIPIAIAVLVIAASAAAVLLLQRAGSEAIQRRMELARLDACTHEMSALEWRMVMAGTVERETEWSLDRVRHQTSHLVAAMPEGGADAAAIGDVREAYRQYAQALDREIELLRAGRRDDAGVYDANHVDPSFDRLRLAVDRAAADLEAHARRSARGIWAGTGLAMLTALLAMAYLFLLGHVAMRRAHAAETGRRQWADSERRYRRLFDALPQPAWVIREDQLRVVAANQAALQLYGYARAAFLRLSLVDLVAERTTAGMLQEQARRTGTLPLSGRRAHRRADGARVEVVLASYPVELDHAPAWLVIAGEAATAPDAVAREPGWTASPDLHAMSSLTTAIAGYAQILIAELDGAGSASVRNHAHEVWRSAREAAVLARRMVEAERPAGGPAAPDA
jgi:PAS domain S-box-containing protein